VKKYSILYIHAHKKINLVDGKAHMCTKNYSVLTGYPNSVSRKSSQSPDPYVCVP